MTKRKWLGSLLNFFIPGLGNAYGRNLRKGIVTYLLFFLVAVGLRFVAYNFTMFLISVILIIGYYGYLIISGYRDVQEDKEYQPARFDKWYVYLLVIIMHVVLVNSIKGRTLDKLTPINFASIPTPAMDPALMIGDILVYKKTKTIERNDVTLFWFPEDRQTLYVKRCIGLPGDSLQIKRSVVLINGNQLIDTPRLKYRYLASTDGEEINSRVLAKYKIDESDFHRVSSDVYQFFLTTEQAEKLKGLSLLKSIELSLDSEGDPGNMIYPKSGKFNWNADFYGPIYIPKKGDKIELTENNILLYLDCIEFENESVEKRASGLMINGQAITDYEFKENYFFMMGDNRHNSFDSRYWGFLPQDLVVGKTMYLYWGRDLDRIGKEVI